MDKTLMIPKAKMIVCQFQMLKETKKNQTYLGPANQDPKFKWHNKPTLVFKEEMKQEFTHCFVSASCSFVIRQANPSIVLYNYI